MLLEELVRSVVEPLWVGHEVIDSTLGRSIQGTAGASGFPFVYFVELCVQVAYVAPARRRYSPFLLRHLGESGVVGVERPRLEVGNENAASPLVRIVARDEVACPVQPQMNELIVRTMTAGIDPGPNIGLFGVGEDIVARTCYLVLT